MRQALDAFLRALGARGMDNPSTALMRSAAEHEQPQAFLATVSSLLGDHFVANWLRLMEQEDYAGATALLAMHQGSASNSCMDSPCKSALTGCALRTFARRWPNGASGSVAICDEHSCHA